MKPSQISTQSDNAQLSSSDSLSWKGEGRFCKSIFSEKSGPNYNRYGQRTGHSRRFTNLF